MEGGGAKGFPRRAVADLHLEPKVQVGTTGSVSGFPLCGGHAQQHRRFVPKVVVNRLKDISAY